MNYAHTYIHTIHMHTYVIYTYTQICSYNTYNRTGVALLCVLYNEDVHNALITYIFIIITLSDLPPAFIKGIQNMLSNRHLPEVRGLTIRQ